MTGAGGLTTAPADSLDWISLGQSEQRTQNKVTHVAELCQRVPQVPRQPVPHFAVAAGPPRTLPAALHVLGRCKQRAASCERQQASPPRLQGLPRTAVPAAAEAGLTVTWFTSHMFCQSDGQTHA